MARIGPIHTGGSVADKPDSPEGIHAFQPRNPWRRSIPGHPGPLADSRLPQLSSRAMAKPENEESDVGSGAWLRSLPPRRELAYRIALADQTPDVVRPPLWAARVLELRRRLRLNGRDGLGKVRASQDYSDAVAAIEAKKRKN